MGRIEQLAEGVTLYLGDARDLLPTLGGVVATDPPYGIGFGYASHQDTESAFTDYMRLLVGRPAAVLQYPEEMMRLIVPVLGAPDEVLAWVYGSNLPRQLRLWGFWGCDVNPARSKQPARNPESAKVQSLIVSGYDWREYPQVKNKSPEKTAHPCQLPEDVAGWVLDCIAADEICDPFMGSGTMGVEAVRRGRGFKGIELDPGYFEIACRRIEAALNQPDFFVETHQQAKQEAFL